MGHTAWTNSLLAGQSLFKWEDERKDKRGWEGFSVLVGGRGEGVRGGGDGAVLNRSDGDVQRVDGFFVTGWGHLGDGW